MKTNVIKSGLSIFMLGVFVHCSTLVASDLTIQNMESQKQGYSMPQELVSYAQSKGFFQVTRFYEINKFVFGPPFVYGVDPESMNHESAAFWATKGSAGDPRYYLVFLFKDHKTEMSKCSDSIKWDKNIGGLSVVENFVYYQNDDFQYLKNPENNLPEKPKRGNAILNEIDGIESLFFCYDGQWVVRFRH